MSKRKSNLARFKNSSQGLIEFACLIEQSEPSQRDAILKMVKQEEPDLLEAALKKVIYFDDLPKLDETIITEVLSKASPKLLAFALYGKPKDFRDTILRTLGHRGIKALMEEESQWSTPPPAALILGAQRRVIKIARMLEAQGKFIIDVPPEVIQLRKTGT